MKIKSLQLKNFKRFTDLKLEGIAESTKLVLLIGSNGSGKSSIFDAFEAINKVLNHTADLSHTEYKNYYAKNKDIPFEVRFYADNDKNEQSVGSQGGLITQTPNAFYGRSAVRYFPRLQRTVIGNPIRVAEDNDRPNYYIDRDNRFENDLDLLLTEIVRKVFGDLNERTKGKIDEVKKFTLRVLGPAILFLTILNTMNQKRKKDLRMIVKITLKLRYWKDILTVII